MQLRDAETSDSESLATVAAESLRASYGHFVDEDTIDQVVDEWYATDRVTELVDDENVLWLVAEDDDVVGFVQGRLLNTEPTTGEIHWLHVVPDARGSGVASELLGQSQERFEKEGAELLHGLVLADNEDGTAFYEAHGFEQVDDTEESIGEDQFVEYVYEKSLGEPKAEEAVLGTVDGPDDGELYVNYSEGEGGTNGTFYATYSSADLEDRYGWYCGNCDSTSTAMDSMGRIECTNCGNQRAATRWDDSYL